ncbi:MAG: hypothetical protein Q7U09_16320, partial [Hydrogenophaga sp.]|nr:hypothetical protein [Hydrogenophaga sp.]
NGLGAALMNKTTTIVIARLDRATQYSRDGRVQPRGRGVLDRPVKPGDDSLLVADGLPSPKFFSETQRRRNDDLEGVTR